MSSGFLTDNYISEFIKNESTKLGFFDCGFSKATQLPNDARRMEMWLDEGMNADMTYLERNKEKRNGGKRKIFTM